MHIIEYWFSCHLTAAWASLFCIFTKKCENKRCFKRNQNQISEGQGTDKKAIAAGFRCALGQRATVTSVVGDAFLLLSPRESIIQMWPGLSVPYNECGTVCPFSFEKWARLPSCSVISSYALDHLLKTTWLYICFRGVVERFLKQNNTLNSIGSLKTKNPEFRFWVSKVII